MASPRAGQPAASVLALVERLVHVSQLDTVYRDVYLGRARELLGPVLPRAEYASLREREAALEQILRESRQAVERLEWARVLHLAERGRMLREALAGRTAELATARRVYEPPDFAFDPFSPGWEIALARRGESIVALRDGLLRTLAALATLDPPWQAFYLRRRDHFAGLVLDEGNGGAGAEVAASPALVAREALQAIDQGDLARVQRLAERMTEAAVLGTGVARDAPPAAALNGCPVDLGAPFPAETVRRARALGLAACELPGPRPHIQTLVDFLYRHARQPVLHPGSDRQDRVRQLREVVRGTQASALTAEVFREFVELFLHHAYVNSRGARYLPPPVPETMLAEDHPEAEEPPDSGPLLEALRLPRRRGLARVAIERALREHGQEIVRDLLVLDPLEFTVVCLPFDAYLRIGYRIGWGRQQRWTHFDGYEVMDGPDIRALVGGDVRYGGLADLVSISPADERPNVVARFAVVRRARLVSRWPPRHEAHPAESHPSRPRQ